MRAVLLLLFVLCLIPARRTYAAAGFQKIGSSWYYVKADGTKAKGSVTIDKKKYQFNSKNGKQMIGWCVNSKGDKRFFRKEYGAGGYMRTGFATISKKVYYFSPKNGYMVKGWLTVGKKKYYMDPGTGVRSTGLMTISGSTYYFDTNGVMFLNGWKTVGKYRYYFDKKTGKAYKGIQTISGKTYYFDSKNRMVKNKTVTIKGVAWKIDKNGYAVKSTDPKDSSATYQYTVMSGYIKCYDPNYKRYYYLAREFATHPGVADGTKTDRDLLAAICECEAGNQGLIGMEAVALCLLNRTLDDDKDFPSIFRYVLYQQQLPNSTNYPQYSPVRNGTLLTRLNGKFNNKALAYQAADEAIKIFNAYKTKGTKRTLKGFDRDDFNFRYFMQISSFWSQALTFSRVDYYSYMDHMFFVRWV